jgi:DNA-binding SARP family transcriptional activator
MTLQAGSWAAGQRREFFLLGRFTVRVDDRPLPGVDGGKIGELLGFLLLFRHQQHHREVLADAIWSGRTTTQARKYLRQGLWRIQSAFAGGLHDLLQVGSDWVWVNDDALEGLDIRKFEIVIQAVKGIAGRDLSAGAADDLQKACALYRGDLLEGWYQDWALYERHRYKARYISMLERLLEYAEAHRKLDDALFYGDRILEHDRAHERTHVRMMRIHYRLGDRTAAMRQFRQCAETLDRELGASPAARTVELFDQIRVDHVTADALADDDWTG